MGHFLIADQDEQLSREIADYFRENGHTVQRAHDGPTARQLVAEQAFDVLICCADLPGAGLAELLRAAKARGVETVVMTPAAVTAPASGTAPVLLPAGGLNLADVERSLLLQALERAGGSRERAARLLGLSPRALASRMRRAGLAGPNPNG